MSHISQLRQRIKVIQTIQKTTSAMRLIAMSLQGRLRKKQIFLKTYQQSVDQALTQYLTLKHGRAPQEMSSYHPATAAPLIVVIGSQKGLCGAFNEHLFAFFSEHHTLKTADRIITIGTYATKFIQGHKHTPEQTFNQFSIATFVSIAHNLADIILKTNTAYVTLFNNIPRTFFIQQPQSTALSISPLPEDHIHAYLERIKLHATLTQLLYESLLAEQSARFLSMDGATQNAEQLLAQTRLAYNKSRQAAITRELIEITSGLDVSS
jgi:F-type H+-transporting ATPase subunit gamma